MAASAPPEYIIPETRHKATTRARERLMPSFLIHTLLALITVLLRTVMHAFITRTPPVSGVTGIALHALSTKMMPPMWEVVLIWAADGNGSVTKIAACRRISFPYNLLFAIFYHAPKTEDTHPVGEPHKPLPRRRPPRPVKWQ